MFSLVVQILFLCVIVICTYFFRLDVSNDLISLHIGDRILEVNGTPVKDQTIENVENLIRYSDTVLQVLSLFLVGLNYSKLLNFLSSISSLRFFFFHTLPFALSFALSPENQAHNTKKGPCIPLMGSCTM